MKRDRPTTSQIPTRIQPSSAQSKASPQKSKPATNNESKNVSMASTNGGQQQTQVKQVIEFIQRTMLTLSEYEKQLQGQFNLVATPAEI